jgi:sigma-B regulation protein RsbU (phosphoserine phosphatase)
VLADALEALEVSVCLADARLPDVPLVWANAAFERLTGYQVHEVLGRNCRFLQEGLPPQPGLDTVRRALASATPVTVVLTNRRADGSLFSNELSITPLHDDGGTLTHFLAVQRDVTPQVDAAAQVDRLSRSMQGDLAPKKLPEVQGLDVAVRYQPGNSSGDGAAVSGDFYDMYAATGGVGEAATWNVAMGDVAGRGAGAAAYTATVRNLLEGIGLSEGSPAQALQLLNSALLDELGDRFVTVALAQLQVRQDAVRATLALGGHPQPVLVSDGEASLVGTPGDLLGALPDATATDERLRLAPGDALLLYTDGITEAGPADDQFGDERLLQAAQDSAGDAGDLVDGVLHAVRQHERATDDDSARLAVRADQGA